MINTIFAEWEALRTDETRGVEAFLHSSGFQQADAYRYNSASIRLRVIDTRFEGLRPEQRDALVEPYLDQLAERTQADIVTMFTFAPSELRDSTSNFRAFLLNTEFEHPSPSIL